MIGRRTLASQLDLHANGLDALRLGLALLVIVDHAPPLSGLGLRPGVGTLTIGGLAVDGFFALSGFLIVGAKLRSTTPRFAWNRFLRLAPALWACLVVTATTFGPLAWWKAHGSVRGYPVLAAARYVAQNALVVAPRYERIPGTLGTNAHHEWNTSLWTLQWEVGCYVGVAVLAGLGLLALRRRSRLLALLGAVLVLGVANATGLAPFGPLTLALRFASTFLAGAVLQRYADRVPVSLPLALVAAGAVLVLCQAHAADPLVAVPLAYLLLVAGAAWRTARLRRFDLSYGVYVYAFPVQQLLALTGVQRHGITMFLMLSVLGTLPLALLSAVLVERPALRLRRWTPSWAPALPARLHRPRPAGRIA